MDEATWAMFLCKDNTADDPVNSIQEYRDDNHNNLETIQQHITDISNSFMEDGGSGQFNNSNSSNSNLSVNNYNNNNNNINSNNNFNNTFSKEYLRLGSNGLPLRNGSPVMDGDEFIDLDKNYHLAMMHYSSSHPSHHNPHHQCNNNNNNTVIFSTMPPEDQISHHQYTDADHNHYHLQNHHLLHRMNYSNAVGPIPHYNPGTDTSSSNASSISAQRNHSHNNNNQRHQVSSYLLRKGAQSTSAIRERADEYHPYMVHQSTASYSNTDQESCSDSESKRQIIVKDEPSTYPARRRPGRPRGSRRKKPEKLGRLWEFIRDLLLNPESCPSLICWDNYEEGMFRFVRSDKVAKLWGEKRDNPEMNYEKLSRAMRYYYKSNVLQPVFGRRLVYKFGPEARGWKTENPNFAC